MTIGELMMQKAKSDNEKLAWENYNLSLLKRDAEKGEPKALYKLGRIYYEQKYFDDAEDCWEKAAHQGHTEAEARLRKLYKNELKNKYNSHGPIPMAASRITCGGNAPRGGWSKWNH